MLAPRVLHFGKEETLWDCFELHDCECGGGLDPIDCDQEAMEVLFRSSVRLPADLGSGVVLCRPPYWERQAKVVDPRTMWYRVVMAYAPLRLTRESDRLLAVARLADEMRQHTGRRDLAGLWEDSIVTDMCWYRDPRGQTGESLAPATGSPRFGCNAAFDIGSSAPTAPSWSWASVTGPVSWDRRLTSILQNPDEDYYRSVDHDRVFDAKFSVSEEVCSLTATEKVVQIEYCPVPLRYDRNKGRFGYGIQTGESLCVRTASIT